MAEPTHAQEHHLRMAAGRAVKFALDDQSRGKYTPRWSVLQDRGINRIKSLRGIKTDIGRAECLERAAGLFLRAAVWLRRSQ